ncbi:MAG: ComEC/Rec2 family competence protein [Bryobacteraceae bacterium]
MRSILAFTLLLFGIAPAFPAAKTLDIYFIDVEGGQATLIVSPSGQSLLVDAGWPGFDGRDANRIIAAAKAAKIKRIDYLVTTHYHTDHVGGVRQLAERFPVTTFVDHGPNTESGRNAETLSKEYAEAVAKGKNLVVKPGDTIPLKGLDVKVVTARGEVLRDPLPGGGAPNPLCAAAIRKNDDPGENARSVGMVVSFGKFRFIDLGDLTWNKEVELVCPNNPIGTVDLYLSTHHGMGVSNPDTIVHALRPRVAVMNNGARKGGSPEAWQVIRNSPGLEDLWQLHFAIAGGSENNVAEAQIANLDANCQGHWIKVSVQQDGAFTVTNGRNGYQKNYPARE